MPPDRGVLGRDLRMSVDELWAAWKAWRRTGRCTTGRSRPSDPTYGRPSVGRRDGDHRSAYLGVWLATAGDIPMDRGPRGPEQPDDAQWSTWSADRSNCLPNITAIPVTPRPRTCLQTTMDGPTSHGRHQVE